MAIHVLFFGKLADIAHSTLGSTSIDVDEKLSSIAELSQHLSALSPKLGCAINHESNLYAVNQNLCKKNASINQGDEVAFMSPLSGG